MHTWWVYLWFLEYTNMHVCCIYYYVSILMHVCCIYYYVSNITYNTNILISWNFILYSIIQRTNMSMYTFYSLAEPWLEWISVMISIKICQCSLIRQHWDGILLYRTIISILTKGYTALMGFQTYVHVADWDSATFHEYPNLDIRFHQRAYKNKNIVCSHL